MTEHKNETHTSQRPQICFFTIILKFSSTINNFWCFVLMYSIWSCKCWTAYRCIKKSSISKIYNFLNFNQNLQENSQALYRDDTSLKSWHIYFKDNFLFKIPILSKCIKRSPLLQNSNTIILSHASTP